MAPPRDDMFYIGLYRVKHEKIFSSETTRPRALIFGMKHHPVNFDKNCSNYALGSKNGLTRGHMFYIGLYIWKNMKK